MPYRGFCREPDGYGPKPPAETRASFTGVTSVQAHSDSMPCNDVDDDVRATGVSCLICDLTGQYQLLQVRTTERHNRQIGAIGSAIMSEKECNDWWTSTLQCLLRKKIKGWGWAGCLETRPNSAPASLIAQAMRATAQQILGLGRETATV